MKAGMVCGTIFATEVVPDVRNSNATSSAYSATRSRLPYGPLGERVENTGRCCARGDHPHDAGAVPIEGIAMPQDRGIICKRERRPDIGEKGIDFGSRPVGIERCANSAGHRCDDRRKEIRPIRRGNGNDGIFGRHPVR
jgi:hypothetical protein